jgi:hypothetical protein
VKYTKAPIYQGLLAKFPRALAEIAKVSAYGAKKHQVSLMSNNYLTVPDASTVYADAVGRHILAQALEGPVNHADGGMLHKAQLAWNALADLEVWLKLAAENAPSQAAPTDSGASRDSQEFFVEAYPNGPAPGEGGRPPRYARPLALF